MPPSRGTQHPTRGGNIFQNIRLPSSAPAQPQRQAGSGSTSPQAWRWGTAAPRGIFCCSIKATWPTGLGSSRAGGKEQGYSLGSRVVQLVLSGAVKTSLDPVVSPQPPDHIGQVLRHDALLLSGAGEREELPSVILQGKNRTRASARRYRSPLCPKGPDQSPHVPPGQQGRSSNSGWGQDPRKAAGPPPLHPSGAMPGQATHGLCFRSPCSQHRGQEVTAHHGAEGLGQGYP